MITFAFHTFCNPRGSVGLARLSYGSSILGNRGSFQSTSTTATHYPGRINLVGLENRKDSRAT